MPWRWYWRPNSQRNSFVWYVGFVTLVIFIAVVTALRPYSRCAATAPHDLVTLLIKPAMAQPKSLYVGAPICVCLLPSSAAIFGETCHTRNLKSVVVRRCDRWRAANTVSALALLWSVKRRNQLELFPRVESVTMILAGVSIPVVQR